MPVFWVKLVIPWVWGPWQWQGLMAVKGTNQRHSRLVFTLGRTADPAQAFEAALAHTDHNALWSNVFKEKGGNWSIHFSASYFTKALQRNISFDHSDLSLIINVKILLTEIAQRLWADGDFNLTSHQHNEEDTVGNWPWAPKASTRKWRINPYSHFIGQRKSHGRPNFQGTTAWPNAGKGRWGIDNTW